MTHTNAETSKPHHIEPEPSAEVCELMEVSKSPVINSGIVWCWSCWGHLKVCALKHSNSDKTGTPIQLAC